MTFSQFLKAKYEGMSRGEILDDILGRVVAMACLVLFIAILGFIFTSVSNAYVAVILCSGVVIAACLILHGVTIDEKEKEKEKE